MISAGKRQKSRLLSLHLSLMSQFLATQESLTLALYHSLRNERSISAVAPGPAQSERPLPPQAPADSRLLSGRHNEDSGICWICELDVQKHVFLRDHAFGKIHSATDKGLLPLPIVPLAYSLELALQAAAEASNHSPASVEFKKGRRFQMDQPRRRSPPSQGSPCPWPRWLPTENFPAASKPTTREERYSSNRN